MAKSASLSLPDLWEIDGLFTKAGTILAEARSRLNAFDHDLAVRRAQESLELSLKSLFRFLQLDYRATHDVRKELYTLSEALENYAIEKRQIARLVLAGSVLNLWRSPAFYGDETLNVGGIFDRQEAELAVSYAELGQIVTSIVRGRIIRESRQFGKGVSHPTIIGARQLCTVPRHGAKGTGTGQRIRKGRVK